MTGRYWGIGERGVDDVQPERIRRILVANRGEIALRVIRACHEMDIEAIAVYAAAEANAGHVSAADDAYVLPEFTSLPYLNVAGIIEIARRARADAIHPGYGFLAENAGFARAVEAAGIRFIGPPAAAIEAMGDKIAARRIAIEAGVPPVPGTTESVSDVASAGEWAARYGYPIAVKASGGGGGRGFRVAREPGGLKSAFEGSRGEAARYFANPDVYLERYLEHPRHIEVQVFADAHGNVVAFPERDCSVQRRHQKLIEETPSPAVSPELRARFAEAATALTKAVDYRGAGTIEFLLDGTGEFYFLEMNTRIQVEHTITEMVTGIDLAREQIRVAEGRFLSFSAADVAPRGWSFEARINAEDAGRQFTPSSGIVTTYREPSGFGVRVDAALGEGGEVSPEFDSLIAKLIVWGRDRDEALARLRRALREFRIEGVPTTIPFHLRVATHPEFIAGRASTTFVTDFPDVLPPPASPRSQDGTADQRPERKTLTVEVAGRRFDVVVLGNGTNGNGTATVRKVSRRGRRERTTVAHNGNDLVSPVQGSVVRVAVEQGQTVEAGDLICVVEAMKMENELTAHKAGTVTELNAKVGDSLRIGATIAVITG
jgi:acetyl-CoA/propionyl-CoA carboxylase biotin carboxyl carrier protein